MRPHFPFCVTAALLLSLAPSSCDDDDDNTNAQDDGGAVDAGTGSSEGGAGDAESDAPASGPCEADGAFVLSGTDIYQLSGDRKLAIKRGTVVAPDGSKLKVTRSSRGDLSSAGAFVVGTPGCGLCSVNPGNLRPDGTVLAVALPNLPNPIEAVSSQGGQSALVYGGGEVTEVLPGVGPSDNHFVVGNVFSGMVGSEPYACSVPDAFSGGLRTANSINYFDFYFVAECQISTTSVNVYGHSAGTYVKNAGIQRNTYEILASTEHTTRYEPLMFDRFSRGEPYFPTEASPSEFGAFHISGGEFVLDPNDTIDICDPATGARHKSAPLF